MISRRTFIFLELAIVTVAIGISEMQSVSGNGQNRLDAGTVRCVLHRVIATEVGRIPCTRTLRLPFAPTPGLRIGPATIYPLDPPSVDSATWIPLGDDGSGHFEVELSSGGSPDLKVSDLPGVYPGWIADHP